MPDSAHVKNWTAALRSGMYEQTTGFLADMGVDGIAYCCLGVVCKIAGIEMDGDNCFDGQDGTLPDRGMDWLGVTVNADPHIDIPHLILDREGHPLAFTCTTANDTLKLTFHQIADLVDYFGIR